MHAPCLAHKAWGLALAGLSGSAQWVWVLLVGCSTKGSLRGVLRAAIMPQTLHAMKLRTLATMLPSGRVRVHKFFLVIRVTCFAWAGAGQHQPHRGGGAQRRETLCTGHLHRDWRQQGRAPSAGVLPRHGSGQRGVLQAFARELRVLVVHLHGMCVHAQIEGIALVLVLIYNPLAILLAVQSSVSGTAKLRIISLWEARRWDADGRVRAQVYDILKPVLLEKEKAEQRLRVTHHPPPVRWLCCPP